MKGDKPLVNLKLVLGVLAALIILVLAVSLFFIIDESSRTVTIRFLVAPSTAKITLNDTAYQSAESYQITPGEYTLRIEKEGFESYEKTITLSDNEQFNVSVALNVLPGNEDYYKQHPGEAYALETIWTDQMIAGSEVVIDNNPLLQILPIDVEYYINNQQYVHYQISFSIADPENVTVLINDYTGGNYDAALTRIRSEGYDPADYHIDYRDLSALYTGTENF